MSEEIQAKRARSIEITTRTELGHIADPTEDERAAVQEMAEALAAWTHPLPDDDTNALLTAYTNADSKVQRIKRRNRRPVKMTVRKTYGSPRTYR